jgi:outer membrane protein TolC
MSRLKLLSLLFLLAAGCTRFQSKPISPERTAEALDKRSLDSSELQQFLRNNLPGGVTEWPRHSWDLDALTFAGFYYHPSLAVARAQWAVAQGGETTAGQRPNPVLTVSPQYNTTTAMASPWLLVASLDVPIETAGKRAKRQAQASRLSEAARLNIAAVAWQVRSAIRTALLDLKAAELRETALRQQQSLQEDLVKRQRQQIEAGAISRAEALPIQLAAQKSQLDLADARRQRADARGRLAEAIGVPVRALEHVRLELDINSTAGVRDMTTAEIRRAALKSRADILGALADYSASQAALQLEIAKQYPDIHLQPGYEFDQGDNKWGIGFSVELPVLSRNQGPIAEAKAKREELAARFIALQAKVLADIDRAIAGFKIGKQNLSISRSLSETQAKRLQSINDQVRAGAADASELLNGQVEAAGTALVQLDNQIKLQQAIGALEDAVQRPLNWPVAALESAAAEHH